MPNRMQNASWDIAISWPCLVYQKNEMVTRQKHYDYYLSLMIVDFNWAINWVTGATDLSSDSLLLGCTVHIHPCPYPIHPTHEHEYEPCESPNLPELSQEQPQQLSRTALTSRLGGDGDLTVWKFGYVYTHLLSIKLRPGP